jgi:hypothetical protein
MQRMTFAVAVLLVSVLSTTGLLALWAANSRRHWLLRTAAFLGVISPLLLVPAHEVFIALSLEGAIVAGGVWLARAICRKRRGSTGEDGGEGPRPWRFSISTLLMTMVLCGVAAAVASQAPTLNRDGWQSVALISACGGLATLLGWRAANRRGWRRWAGMTTALIVSASIAVAPAWLDWFLPSFDLFADWPPDPTSAVAALLTPPERPLLPWFGIVPGVAGCVFACNRLAMSVANTSIAVAATRRRRGWVAKVALIVVLLLISLPSASAMFCLLTPEPIPNDPLPSPNGYDDFVAAGRMLEQSTAWRSYLNATRPKEAELKKAAAASSVALNRGRLGLQRDVMSRVNYLDANLGAMEPYMALRNFGRLLLCEGMLAEIQQRYGQAVESYVDCIEFGIRSCRGGLMIDALIGFASALAGAKELHGLRGDLSADACRTAAAATLTSLENLEPKELFQYRDRIWEQHSSGWHGRLMLGLTDLTEDYFMDMAPEAFLYTHDRNVAALRILALELLARAIFLESGDWPQSAEEVRASANLPQKSLIDPFDPAGGLLRMKAVNEGVEFYSVGENGVDDGGIAPNVENEDGVMEGGDLRLAEVFKPLEWESEGNEADAEENAGDDGVELEVGDEK